MISPASSILFSVFGKLLRFTDFEHLGAHKQGIHPGLPGGRSSWLSLGIFHFFLGATLHTIALHWFPPFW
jgi:hypothetical protein